VPFKLTVTDLITNIKPGTLRSDETTYENREKIEALKYLDDKSKDFYSLNSKHLWAG